MGDFARQGIGRLVEIGRLGGLAVLDLEGLWTRYDDPTDLLAEIAELPEEAATARMFRDEVKARVAAGEAASANENIRLMWIGAGVWHDPGFYSALEEQIGAVFVWSMYLPFTGAKYIRYNLDDPYPSGLGGATLPGNGFALGTWPTWPIPGKAQAGRDEALGVEIWATCRNRVAIANGQKPAIVRDHLLSLAQSAREDVPTRAQSRPASGHA